MRTLYLALVISQLEYCSVVWSPHTSWHTSRNISKLVRIQRRATKFILKTMMITNNGEKKLNLLSLEQRRFSFDALFLYKALSGYINIDLSTYVQFFLDSDRYPLRGKDECTLKTNYARTNIFKLSLVFSIGSWTCGTLYHCLFVRQQLWLVLRKKWGSFKLEMCEVFIIIIIILLIFLYISLYAFSHF